MRQTQHWRAVRVAVVAVVVVLSALVGAPAHGHSGLVASTPGDGDTISSPLARVALAFGTPIDPHHVEVVVQDASGRTVSHGAAVVSGSSVEQALRLSSPGEHSVGYRVVGSDGHAVVGSFTFTATAAAVAPDGDAGSPSRATGSFQVASSDPGEELWSRGTVVLVLAAGVLALVVMTVVGVRGRAVRALEPDDDY
ncbi:MAG: copper resistance CopC family protein [Nocardioides marinisabuli]|uniref:copper resistance CopC family protein n=1 Tax=Nocardioides marinisabuli TaxID=419476 RepID=UPI00321B91D2